MKWLSTLLFLSPALTLASECLDLTGRYAVPNVAGCDPTIPSFTLGRRSASLLPGSTIEFRQRGCAEIEMRFQDRDSGRTEETLIDFSDDPVVVGSWRLSRRSIRYSSRENSWETEGAIAVLTKSRFDLEWTLDDAGALLLDSVEDERELIYGTILQGHDHDENHCVFVRAGEDTL